MKLYYGFFHFNFFPLERELIIEILEGNHQRKVKNGFKRRRIEREDKGKSKRLHFLVLSVFQVLPGYSVSDRYLSLGKFLLWLFLRILNFCLKESNSIYNAVLCVWFGFEGSPY